MTTPAPIDTTPVVVDQSHACDNGSHQIGTTLTGQPAFVICGPTNEMNPSTGTPEPDTCFDIGLNNGIGQTSRSLQPCSLSNQPVALVAVATPPVVHAIHVATIGTTLPATGSQNVAPIIGAGGVFIALGTILCIFRRHGVL